MVSLELIVSFASAARHSSFAKAARELSISPSAVAKNIARLEAQLGVRLFHRTTRRVTLSQEGEDLRARCQLILEQIESLETETAAARTGPRGTLRIDVPIVYGRQVVVPILARLVARHPGLKIDARFSDQVVDIVNEGLDAAIRVGALSDSRLVGRVFDQQVLWTCASPAYLQRHGTPETPGELPAHDCLPFRLPSSGRDRPWQFRVGRRELSLAPEGRMRLGDGEALVQAAVAGLGIVQVPGFMAEDHVRRGSLAEILHAYRPVPTPIWLVYPSHRHVPLRVRVLVDALDEHRSAAR